MQAAKVGIPPAMRIYSGGAARSEEAGVGAGASGNGRMSQVSGDAAEFGMDRKISDVEVRGRRRVVGLDGARCGRGINSGKGVAEWPAGVH